ncbi:MAG: hybrid sensor histidine kinase/response regulator [Aquabacterium sp.]|nr:hybrid sensor histidine kinase/response regulator [Aquabacterium sp.]
MSIWWRTLRGKPPIEARIDLQILQDLWRTAPESIISQLLVILVLLWEITGWHMARWKWMIPLAGLLTTWAIVSQMARHFRRFGIPASRYEYWRKCLLWWHGIQGTLWGLLIYSMLSVSGPEWRVTLIAGSLAFVYCMTLVTIHDWGVSFIANMPLLLLVSGGLLLEQTQSALFLVYVLMGSEITCMLFGRGLSRRLRQRALLRHENADLVLQLREEINKVNQAKAKAETADKQKSEFFASASHDLRQPLHVLMLLSSALKRHVDPVEGAPLLGKINTAVGSLSTMFEKMFDVARIDAQRIDYTAQALPLAALWSRLDNEFAVLCQSKGLHWVIEPTKDWVQVDPHVLERILRNLLNNAVRYTEKGEVRLRARARGASIVCQVWDTGVGVPHQHKTRIFEDYFQANNDARRSSEGLGLGLAVVRRLSMLGPTPVTLLSRPGRGSCFAVRLPRLIPSDATGQAIKLMPKVAPDEDTDDQDSKDDMPSSRGVVVLIDDEPDVLESTALILQQHGWITAASTTPDGALDAVIRFQEQGLMPEGEMPVALISDHRLGLSVNGLDVIRNLRYEFGDQLPAFLITGEASPGLAQEAKDAQVHLLHKPVHADRMVRLLQEAISGEPEPD